MQTIIACLAIRMNNTTTTGINILQKSLNENFSHSMIFISARTATTDEENRREKTPKTKRPFNKYQMSVFGLASSWYLL